MEFRIALVKGVPLFAFLLYTGLLTLSLKSSHSKISRIFQYYLLLMLIWSFGSFMMRTGIFPGPLLWNRFMVLGTVGVPFVFFHFSVEILGQTKTFLVKSGYIFFGLFVIANFLGLIVEDASLSAGIFSYTLGSLALIFGVVGSGYILASAMLLISEGFVNPDSFWSNQLVYPSIGAVLMVIGSALNLLPIVGQYPVDITTNTINAFLLTYAIYRYRLLDITISIRKGLVYSVLTIMITGSYLLIVYLLEKVIRTKLGYTTFAIALVMAVIIAILFEPVDRKSVV